MTCAESAPRVKASRAEVQPVPCVCGARRGSCRSRRLLRVRPDKLTWPEITTEVVEVGSAVAVWEGTLLGGTDEGVLVQAAADLELREARGTGSLRSSKEAVLDKLYRDDGMKLWVAEGGGCSALKRLESVPGTAFAGIWGGVTRGTWRGRGTYRALTAAWAKSALRMGPTLIHSDSTEFCPPDS